MNLLQFLKDIREENTLEKKWVNLNNHLPFWAKRIEWKRYSDGCLIDAGCHYGYISIQFIQETHKPSYAFDINPKINSLLSKKIQGTQYNKLFHVMGFGLGEREENKTMFIDTKYSGAATIKREQIPITKSLTGIDLRPKERVSIRRLDKVPILEKVSLIKIDVEGYENNVIKGATETIVKYQPTIIFESLTIQENSRVTKTLERLNYNVFRLDDRNFIGEPI